MFRFIACFCIACVILAAVMPSSADAQKKKVTVSKTWSGSVADEKAMKPDAITNAKAFEALWKEWKAQGDVPKVDFAKDIVVGVYSVGSKLNLAGANLDERGNLDVLGFGTRDIQPGFRYVLGVVSREGVKFVNRKPLPE